MRRSFQKFGRVVEVCRGCGHVAVPGGVAKADDGLSIYESERPIFERDGNEPYYLDETNTLAARDKASFVRRHAPAGGRLLDAGSSFGHFLAAVGGAYEATGVELSPIAAAWAREHLGVQSLVGSVYDLPASAGGPVDVLTSWDVIEHLERPIEALRKYRETLRPGGWLFLSTPDAGSLVARLMGRHWHYLDPLQHINLFSLRNLVRVLERTGFRVEAIVSFGHWYRVRYVLSRLRYLTRESLLRFPTAAAAVALQPLEGRALFLKLWDVVGIAAQR